MGDSGQIIHCKFLGHLITAIQFEYTSFKIIMGSSSGSWWISGEEDHDILHLDLKAVIEGNRYSPENGSLGITCTIYQISCMGIC